MKKIEAIIKTFRLDEVKEGLTEIGIVGIDWNCRHYYFLRLKVLDTSKSILNYIETKSTKWTSFLKTIFRKTINH